MKARGKERNKYLSLSRWTSGELCFWRSPNPETPSTGYAKEKYEAILEDWKSRERTLSHLQGT